MNINESAEYYARFLANKELAEHSFIVGANSPAAKEKWQQGMYTEGEVKVLSEILYHFAKHGKEPTYTSLIFEEWFEQNKKK